MQMNCINLITHVIRLNGIHAKGSDHTVRKFKIPSVPPTTSKTIRFPNDVIAGVESAIQGRDCTFTAFVIEAVRVALDSLGEEEE